MVDLMTISIETYVILTYVCDFFDNMEFFPFKFGYERFFMLGQEQAIYDECFPSRWWLVWLDSQACTGSNWMFLPRGHNYESWCMK